ncbi:MAG: carboxymuconolactone decarboxylase family protein [Planctomycetes bacterium]|nr:carboxymuconolactone decarboxylase family protein [Planctomycetota bacterium]NOG55393.1 carboxymuconolactone decarboxylase family protein [Planctomycetota bacterium]
MPRLNVVDPATASGKAKELFDGPLKGKHLNIFKGLANNASILEGYLQFSGALKGGRALSPAEHEVVALTVGQLNGCDYCLAAHTMLASGAGLDVDQTIKIRKGQADDDRHSALSKFVTALVEKKGHIADTELAEFKNAGFGDDAVVETIGAVAVNYLTNFFNHVNNTDVDGFFQPAPAID